MSGDENKLKKYRFPETLTNQSRWFGLPLDELIPAAICIGWATVKATFGKDSSVVKWVVLAEVLVGAVMYMMTKNVKFLAGFAIISVFIAVGMAVVGL